LFQGVNRVTPDIFREQARSHSGPHFKVGAACSENSPQMTAILWERACSR